MLDFERDMICVIGFCQKDIHLVYEQLQWIKELGGCPNHDVLLVADAGTQWSECIKIMELAGEAFRLVKIITTAKPVEGWIPGANALFWEAANWCQNKQTSFLWLEPDAIPLKFQWLDIIDRGYDECGKPFMGTLFKAPNANYPDPYLEGVGVYPADTLDRFKQHWNQECWIISCAPASVPNAVGSPLIQTIWGQPGIATSFVPVRTADSAPQDKGIDFLHKLACVYHRTKDSSLIPLLRKKLFPSTDYEGIAAGLKKNYITITSKSSLMAGM